MAQSQILLKILLWLSFLPLGALKTDILFLLRFPRLTSCYINWQFQQQAELCFYLLLSDKLDKVNAVIGSY